MHSIRMLYTYTIQFVTHTFYTDCDTCILYMVCYTYILYELSRILSVRIVTIHSLCFVTHAVYTPYADNESPEQGFLSFYAYPCSLFFRQKLGFENC